MTNTQEFNPVFSDEDVAKLLAARERAQMPAEEDSITESTTEEDTWRIADEDIVDAEVVDETLIQVDADTKVDIEVEASLSSKPKPYSKQPVMSDTEIMQRVQKIQEMLDRPSTAEPDTDQQTAMGAAALDLTNSTITPDAVAQKTPDTSTIDAAPVSPDAPAPTTDMKNDAKISRKDFVEQQEDRFGANDDIKPEDVPEGELTYEQYLAQRPVAEKGDFYHHNNRVYSAVPTEPMKNKKAVYAAKYDTAAAGEHYDNLLDEANSNDVIDDALKENAIVNEGYGRTIRTNIEGEFLVEKDVRLKGLLRAGEELLALHNSKLTGEEFEKTIKPALEEKQASYDTLYEAYEAKGLDERALWYIEDKTNARVEDPDFIPVEGSAYLNEEKVTILDFTETPDGKKAYTIEKADGSIEAVDTSDVDFKREFEKYEAPEEKLSRFERTKKWFGKERKKIQEFGGLTYMGNAFSGALGKAGEWLNNRHIDEETMTPEQIQSQKLINRRNNLLGLAAGVVVGMLVQKTGVMIFDSFTPPSAETVDTLGLGENGYRYTGPVVEPGHADGGEFVPHLLDVVESMDVNGVDNPAYNIPNSGGGEALFNGLNMSTEQWKEHAQELLKQFPDVLYPENGDVRFIEKGTPPIEFRKAIEKIRNS
jgi:hypothetical protein